MSPRCESCESLSQASISPRPTASYASCPQRGRRRQARTRIASSRERRTLRLERPPHDLRQAVPQPVRTCSHKRFAGAERLVQQCAHVGERIECAGRRRAVHTFDIVQRGDDGLTAPVERLTHLVHGVKRSGHGCDRGTLGDIVHVRRHMPLQLGCGLRHVERSDHPADTPAGHSVGFGHAVEHQQLITHFRHCSADIRGFAPS